ncbi:hypothetical protein ABT288_46185 [Streptomyces sp. NPDC001093]|uniref:hypothetical protein n=1 Tax=Streptomyces sp. NPDC001093 TaxID=3154376 RepID=UPI00332DD53E
MYGAAGGFRAGALGFLRLVDRAFRIRDAVGYFRGFLGVLDGGVGAVKGSPDLEGLDADLDGFEDLAPGDDC